MITVTEVAELVQVEGETVTLSAVGVTAILDELPLVLDISKLREIPLVLDIGALQT